MTALVSNYFLSSCCNVNICTLCQMIMTEVLVVHENASPLKKMVEVRAGIYWLGTHSALFK